LEDGDSVPVGDYALRVYHTPGHIDDLICYALWGEGYEGDQRVIVGDAIFEGGPGKTWSPEGFQTTLETLQKVILAWPDDAICYPGHGPSFRLGDIRADVGRFVAQDHGSFYGDATWDM
jgi:hydroxyacylglutathione hydrolase